MWKLQKERNIQSHKQYSLLDYLFDNVCKTVSKSILTFCESKYTLNNKHIKVLAKYLAEIYIFKFDVFTTLVN